ncbi:excisionase [Serratia fonticola]
MLTIRQWNERQPIKRNEETIRRLIREGKIWPAPEKDGKEWLLSENAKRIDGQSKKPGGLLSRIRNGKSQKHKAARPAAKPLCS